MSTDKPNSPSSTPGEHAGLQRGFLTLSEHMWPRLREQMWADQRVGRAIAQAVAAEREACAKVAVGIYESIKDVPDGGDWIGGSQRAHNAVVSALAEVAGKIRARGGCTPDPCAAGEETKAG